MIKYEALIILTFSVHSLAKILCLYDNITLHYVSPTKELGMPEHVKQYVRQYSNFEQVIWTKNNE